MTVTQPTTLKLGKKTPGGALGYTWHKAGEVLDVAVKDAYELIRASHGDIYEVLDVVKTVEEVIKLAEAGDKELDTPILPAAPKTSTDLTDALAISSATAPKRGRPKKDQ